MKSDRPKRSEKMRRGVYILPNLFTTMNMFCGFYAVIASVNGRFHSAAVAIVLAVIFDILDGKIARATNATSAFGVEYDSLADLISFGLAPGVMMYLWILQPMGRIGWLAGFLFLACGALRLARFNTQSATGSSSHFTGLPIPAAAGMNATTVLLLHRLGLTDRISPLIILIMLYALSFLMVSTIKYHSFKKPELFKQKNFNMLVAAILVLMFIAAQPPIALFMIAVTYVLSGPIISVRHHRRSAFEDADADEIEET